LAVFKLCAIACRPSSVSCLTSAILQQRPEFLVSILARKSITLTEFSSLLPGECLDNFLNRPWPFYFTLFLLNTYNHRPILPFMIYTCKKSPLNKLISNFYWKNKKRKQIIMVYANYHSYFEVCRFLV
jgi:hypothetical protein